MTQIDWNQYFESDVELTESAVKDEGEFATVALLDSSNTLYKVHIGLTNGMIIDADGLTKRLESITIGDLDEVKSECW